MTLFRYLVIANMNATNDPDQIIQEQKIITYPWLTCGN